MTQQEFEYSCKECSSAFFFVRSIGEETHKDVLFICAYCYHPHTLEELMPGVYGG